METARLRVLLVTRRSSSRSSSALRRTLEREYDAAAAVSDGATTLAQALRLSPDVGVGDVGMAGWNGFDVARAASSPGGPDEAGVRNDAR